MGWLASLMSDKLQGFYLAASPAVSWVRQALMQGAAPAGDRIITVIALGGNSRHLRAGGKKSPRNWSTEGIASSVHTKATDL